MPSNKQHGFSLLEILIAFTILAFSLTILLKIFSTGVSSAGVSEEYTAAVQIAESMLARVGTEIKLQRDGGDCKKWDKDKQDYDKYRCELAITPINFRSGLRGFKAEPIAAQLFNVEVTVSWDAGDNDRQVNLTAIKLLGTPAQ
ncbi:type IV pilus modification PilV family protein [Crenothrix polyspora]|nr:prepilin-type N-terminal cleavage/methylation domain-containing protein [Crenothrix polyspora]